MLFKFDISYSQLAVSIEAVERALGYITGSIPIHFKDVLIQLIHESQNHLQIKGGFRLLQNNVRVENRSRLMINNIDFIIENIIATQLQNIEGSVLFACTLGKQFDHWCRSFDDQNDIFYHYFAEAIGSEIIEASVDWLEKQINIEAAKLSLKCTNRYSPGYCDWNVSDQHKLFSFFPAKFCGIEITASALMIPIKSISGLIGLGENVRKKAYTCNICSMENCYLRIRDYG